MGGAAAGSGWWEEPADGDDDAERAPREPPVDDRTTQPMPRIDRTEPMRPPPASPWPSSPDTVRVEAPAWFLRAQKRAAEQSRIEDGTGRGGHSADADHDRSDELGAAGGSDPREVGSRAAGDAPPVTPIDPNAVRHELDVAPQGMVTHGQEWTSAEPADTAKLLDPTVAASYRAPTPPPDLASGSLGLLGGAMLSIGSFLTWGRSTGVVEATVTGVTGSNGWGTLACGVVVAFGAVLLLAGRRSGLIGGAMMIAALAAVYFCGFSAVDILRTGDELPDILVGAGIDRDTAAVATLELTGGFAVVVAGAAAALAAGTIAFARRV